MSLYDEFAARPGGGRALAKARLQRAVLRVLDRALKLSRVESQTALAKKLHIRKSAVNQVFRGDGNVRISTLAEYLYELGFEVDLKLVSAGELRRAALEGRLASNVQPSQAVLEILVTSPPYSGLATASQSTRPFGISRTGITMAFTAGRDSNAAELTSPGLVVGL
jgi:hypothetical protein